MKQLSLVVFFGMVLGLGFRVYAEPQRAASVAGPAMAVGHTTTALNESQTALVKQYCATCHNDRNKNNAAGLSLQGFDAAKIGHDADVAETAEKMIRKLRSGMMPPSGSRRPDAAMLTALASSMETRLDQAAALNPNPGRRPFQRLNRAEYAAAVAGLFDLDVDVAAFLPPDTISAGFDNVADTQNFSATLMEGYLRAASRISSLAVGDPMAGAAEATYKVPRTGSQMVHIEGAPFGTRGGLSVLHTFPENERFMR